MFVYEGEPVIAIEIRYLNTGRIELRPLNRTVLTWIRREAKQLEVGGSYLGRGLQVTRIV